MIGIGSRYLPLLAFVLMGCSYVVIKGPINKGALIIQAEGSGALRFGSREYVKLRRLEGDTVVHPDFVHKGYTVYLHPVPGRYILHESITASRVKKPASLFARGTDYFFLEDMADFDIRDRIFAIEASDSLLYYKVKVKYGFQADRTVESLEPTAKDLKKLREVFKNGAIRIRSLVIDSAPTRTD